MALFKIVRVYEVPGKDQVEAINNLSDAVQYHVEKSYHVGDYIRDADDPPGKGRRFRIHPPTGWLKILRDQVLGK